jgi:hypothetical protein
MLTHAKMYEIGDKYYVMGLKELAKEKFAQTVRMHWDNSQFPIAATHAFTSTPEEDQGLRDIVRRAISDHIALVEKPEINALMKEHNGLAYALFMEKAVKHNWIKARAA